MRSPSAPLALLPIVLAVACGPSPKKPAGHAEPAAADAGAAAPRADDAERARGRGYSVPVPSGFARKSLDLTRAIEDAGGIVLVEATRPALDDAFLGSIIVIAIDEPQAAAAPSCDERAAKIGAATGSECESRTVTTPGSRVCQFDCTNKKHENRGVIPTMVSPRWLIVCNVDKRDTLAAKACTDVVKGWREDAP